MNANGSAVVPTTTKVRGIVLMVLGSGLAVGCGAVLVTTLPLLLNAGKVVDGTTFTGTAKQGLVAAALLAWTALLGLVFAAGGVQLFRNGRYFRRFGIVAAIMVGITIVGIYRVGQAFF